MRNKRFFVVLAGALVFGLLAAVTVSRYLASAQAYSKDLNRVVVAKVAIPVGTKIIAEQVMAVQFSKESTPDGVFESADKLIGRVAVVNIAPREPVTESRLAPVGTAGGLSAVIPEGYRAMTVKVDDVVGISGFIMPGTLVDVVVVITPSDTSNQDPISKIVLQSIKVLANGQNIDKPESEREPNSVKAVTLLVTPEQAEKLALAASEGKLQLVMRNSIDEGDEHTNGVNKRGLLTGDHASPQPEPGSLKSEQPAKTQAVPVPRRVRAQAEPKPAAAVSQVPEKPRASVEMIEGAKKRSVDFP
ncbi:MAG: Flp pilus assembly protein CpaB [Acidobacteriota bacterium]|nr:Flp pilus assembly protein CpaB [Acidobacteriota bacterium]